MFSFLLQALIHGLNRHYYSIAINYRKNELEQKMLMNLNKKSWMDGLSLKDYNDHCSLNQVGIREIHQGQLGWTDRNEVSHDCAQFLAISQSKSSKVSVDLASNLSLLKISRRMLVKVEGKTIVEPSKKTF